MKNQFKNVILTLFVSAIIGTVSAQGKSIETPHVKPKQAVKLQIPAKVVKAEATIDKPELNNAETKPTALPQKPKVHKIRKAKLKGKINGKSNPNAKAYKNADEKASFKKGE